jgi:hypothetical protein
VARRNVVGNIEDRVNRRSRNTDISPVYVVFPKSTVIVECVGAIREGAIRRHRPRVTMPYHCTRLEAGRAHEQVRENEAQSLWNV